MSELINPYIAGAPVTETRMFFGRDDVFDWIQNSLSGRYADHILVIHGQRRVGKTSVLKQLGNRLPDKYIPVFFDLQGRTHTTLDRFMWWLAREIVRVLKQERDITVPVPEKDSFAADPEYFESRFLPSLRPHIGERSLLLTFDEFDNLEEGEIKEELARPLIDYLRRLMGEEGISFIFSIGSSGRKLENMQASYTEFFKTALYKKISFLSREQTAGLITRPVEGLLEYERKAVERIFDITSGHPYFTQLICHELFSLCQRTGELRIRETDVEAILDDVVERGTVNLKFTWDEASDLEKWNLAALAHHDKLLDNHALGDFLRKQRVRFSDSDLTSSMLHLREKDILTNDNRFVIYLLKLWLRKNRTLEQAREELTEVSPIANRYIEIGLEFQDSGLYDKAIENFKEALAISPDNIQAQVNIALAHMAQGSLSQAVAEFEKALAMDDEDIASRSGLCEATLALGDAASEKGKPRDAIQAYQKVLSINAEHTEARQRLAEINRGRAEKALTNGQDEEALAAFAEALKFTPEDEALSARYEQAKVEKRTKVLKSLLLKADKEQAVRNWEAALKILENALEIAPGEEKVQTQIAVVKSEQRKEELQAILARADRAAGAGRWGLVIAALEEYLTLEPGDAKIRARIEDARRELTEARVEEARARSRGLARQERFEEAIAAWNEYLKLNPADNQTVQAELEKIHRAQTLARNYVEAQKAFSTKNYEKAVSLFKSIVVEDADYKDATRLMAEAIESRRAARKWWQSKWLWGAITSSVILIVGWLAFRPGSPLLASLSSPSMEVTMTTSAPTIAPISTNTPGPTNTPSPTPTPLPLAWTRLNSGQFLPRDTITAIVIDPTDLGVIYVGTDNAGVFKSIDGGLSWQPSHAGLGRAWIYSLVMDPQDPQTLYAGTLLGGVYKTTDSGATWSLITKGLETGWEWISIVALDPGNSQHLYYTQASHIYESPNSGDSWQEIHDKETCPDNVVGLVTHPGDSSILYSSQETHPSHKCDPGIYRSTDGGRNWTFISADVPTSYGGWGSVRWNLALEQMTGEVLIAYNDGGDLYRTRDQGVTWEQLPSHVCHAFTLDHQNGMRAYCADENRIFQTLDGGESWQEIARLDNKQRLRTITVSPNTGDTMLLGGSGLWLSIDGGKSFETRNSGLAAVRFELYLDPSDPSALLAQAICDFYRSSDGARTWEVDDYRSCYMGFSKPPPSWPIEQGPESLFAHPTIPGKLYAVYNRDKPPYLHISDDGGQSWSSAVGMGSIADGKLFFDHDQGQRVYAIGDMDAYRSDDAGETWQECTYTNKWSARATSRMVVDPRNPDYLILATRGDGVVTSTDGCQSWDSNNTGLGSLFVNTLAFDPNNPDTIYAGTDGGAYVSFDGGQTWGQVNDGLLGATVVYSIAVDKESNVYAATPYGIFKLEGK